MDHAEIVRDIQVLTGAGDRRAAARRLLEGWRARDLKPEDLQQLMPDVRLWLDPPGGPLGALRDDEWVELFRAAGLFVHGPPVSLGADALVVFRAAPVERARGMS